jgi:hypothetical protein
VLEKCFDKLSFGQTAVVMVVKKFSDFFHIEKGELGVVLEVGAGATRNAKIED